MTKRASIQSGLVLAVLILLTVGCATSAEVTTNAEATRSRPAAESSQTESSQSETPTETPAPRSTATTTTEQAEPAPEPAGTAQETAIAEVEVVANPVPEYTLLGTFDPRSLLRRIYVLVEPGLRDAELIRLADVLRAEANADPAHADMAGVEHYVMDDGSHFETLLQELPRTEQGDTSNWPIAYVSDHTVAYTKLYLIPDGEGGVDRAYLLCFEITVGCDIDNQRARFNA